MREGRENGSVILLISVVGEVQLATVELCKKNFTSVFIYFSERKRKQEGEKIIKFRQ